MHGKFQEEIHRDSGGVIDTHSAPIESGRSAHQLIKIRTNVPAAFRLFYFRNIFAATFIAFRFCFSGIFLNY